MCKSIMHYVLRSRHVCSLPGVVVHLHSQSPHLHAKGEFQPLAQSSFIPPHFPLRFAPLARVILGAVSKCWFREFRKRSLDWGQGRNMVYRGYVWPTYQRRGCDGGGRRESAKSEGKHNGELRPQLRGRTPAPGRRRDRGDHRGPACHLKGATRSH